MITYAVTVQGRDGLTFPWTCNAYCSADAVHAANEYWGDLGFTALYATRIR